MLIVIAETVSASPPCERRLPRGILSQARRQDASHQAFIHAGGINPRSARGFPHYYRAQLNR